MHVTLLPGGMKKSDCLHCVCVSCCASLRNAKSEKRKAKSEERKAKSENKQRMLLSEKHKFLGRRKVHLFVVARTTMHKVANYLFVSAFVVIYIVGHHERCDAAVINWVGHSQGFWDMQSSWSSAQLPTLDDDVIISNAAVVVRNSCAAKSLLIEQEGQLEIRKDTVYNILNISIIDSSQLTLGHDITMEYLHISGGVIVNANTFNS